MLDVKKALAARGKANAALVAKLGGEHVYEADHDVDVAKLFTDGAAGLVTFACVSDVTDPDLPRNEQVYQFDIWAQAPDTADEIAELVTGAFVWRADVAGSGILPGLTARRLGEPISEETGPRDLPREDGAAHLHHRTRSIRVITYPV